MTINKDYLLTIAPNESALKNGENLAKKNSYSNLTASSDGTYIGGFCTGSGASPYACSVDFIDPAAPVFRCTCPSRQFPCKHILGLLYIYAEGRSFQKGDVPEDILDKRKKKESRASAKAKSDDAPPKDSPSRKRAAIKKIETQLNGLEETEKILHNIVSAGLGTLDAAKTKSIRALVKQLDSYYITGVQNELNDLLGLFNQAGEVDYYQCVGKIASLHTLVSRARAYFEKKLEHPDKMDSESEIEELVGYPWKLEELRQYGLMETNARLVQLCFFVRREDDKTRFVDEGYYISLNTGRLVRTFNYRPYKALKHIREEDTVFPLLNIPELFTYPSRALNPRVRWETFSLEPLTTSIYEQILAHARDSIDEAVKEVKNQLKDTMLFKHPALLVRCDKLSLLDGGLFEFVVQDSRGASLMLKPNAYCGEHFISLLDRLPPKDMAGCALLLLFDNDVESGLLSAQPLAVVTSQAVIRLVF